MDFSGKQEEISRLKEQARELMEWMMNHTSPDTSAEEFCEVAGRWAYVCTRMYQVEKNW